MRTAAVLLLLGLTGCPARPVTPVALSQPGDGALECAALDREIAALGEQAAAMGARDRELERRNVIGAILFGAPAIDLTREEQIQFRALQDRARHLAQLKAAKPCSSA